MSERTQIALQLVLVLGVLAAAMYGIVSSAGSEPTAIATPSPAGPDASLIASTLRSRSPSPSPRPSPTAAPTVVTLPPSPTPTPTPRAPVSRTYTFGGRVYTGVELGKGWTVLAPFDGQLEYVVYQIINGEFRTDTDVAGVPSYPYFTLTAADGRKLVLRPGALTTDTEPLARSSVVRAGDPLFKVIGEGYSSWRERYDRTITFQIVVSLVNSAGADLDASTFFKVK